MSEPLVSVRDLHYRYAEAESDVLRIPFLDVSGTGLIAVTGPSGAGKTTLVELLAGTLQEPYEGTVTVLGADWQKLRRDADRQRQLRRIGLIPQDFGLLANWTARRTLEQDLIDADVPAGQRSARIQASLAQVGLSDFAEREIGSLSGGQRQRVAIARMLARDVELVIADEPTANLDPGLVSEIAGLFKVLAQKVPVIVVTHDPRLAEVCDRTIVLQAAVQGAQQGSAQITAPDRRRSRGRLVTVLVIALIVVTGLAAAYATLGNHSKSHAPRQGLVESAAQKKPTPSASPSVFPSVRVTLPVETLATAEGIDTTPEPLYPAVVTADIPQPWAKGVGAYGVAGYVFIAPADWYGSGIICADGSVGASLHAGSGSATPGSLDFEVKWSGQALSAAGSYFPWVRTDCPRWGLAPPTPVARPGLVERFVGKHTAWYTATRAKGLPRGLVVSGVAHAAGVPPEAFDRLELDLPPSDTVLANAILRYYVSPETNAITGVCYTFQQYFDGIGADYQQSWQQLSPHFQSQTTFKDWSSGMSSVIDSNIVIHYINTEGTDAAVAYVTFMSDQSASQGPDGDTQDHWTLDYRMVRRGWQWLIDYVGPHNGSTHTSG